MRQQQWYRIAPDRTITAVPRERAVEAAHRWHSHAEKALADGYVPTMWASYTTHPTDAEWAAHEDAQAKAIQPRSA